MPGQKVLNLSGESLPVEGNGFFQLLEESDIICQDSTAFLQDYRNLMGKLSTPMASRLWWATNIASKNRFASRIPILLQQIEVCVKTIATDYCNLIIYKPDFSLISTLKSLCIKSGIELSYVHGYVRYHLLKQRLRWIASHVKSCLRLMYRLAIVRLFYTSEPDQGSDHKVIVLKSFFYEKCVNEKDGYNYKDPFFGRLPDFIAEKTPLLILTEITDRRSGAICGRYLQSIKKINLQKNFTIVPVEYWLSIKSILSSFFKVLISRLDKKIPNVLIYRGINVSAIFRTELYRKCNDIPLQQFLFYPLMKACFKSRKIQKYIQTCENYPWEKMALAAIQEVKPNTKTIGFQHAVVPQASVNMFISSEEQKNMPLPQNIFCVGQEPLDIINIFSESTLNNIETSCGLRYEYLQKLEVKPRKKIQKILIAPEGLPDVFPMLNYVLDQLKIRQEYQLTFRFHSNLPYETAQKKFGFDLGTVANANVSQALLHDDLMNHDLCIYWGSTVSLEALSVGMPLIHYDIQTVLSYDPLFRCRHLKWTVTKCDSLPDVIEKINSLSNKEFSQQINLAKEYIANYFFPVTDENLEKFI